MKLDYVMNVKDNTQVIELFVATAVKPTVLDALGLMEG